MPCMRERLICALGTAVNLTGLAVSKLFEEKFILVVPQRLMQILPQQGG